MRNGLMALLAANRGAGQFRAGVAGLQRHHAHTGGVRGHNARRCVFKH